MFPLQDEACKRVYGLLVSSLPLTCTVGDDRTPMFYAPDIAQLRLRKAAYGKNHNVKQVRNISFAQD